MKAPLRILALSLLTLAALSSCATNEPKPYEDDISQLPQNRPQSWEGNAALGSFFPGAQ